MKELSTKIPKGISIISELKKINGVLLLIFWGFQYFFMLGSFGITNSSLVKEIASGVFLVIYTMNAFDTKKMSNQLRFFSFGLDFIFIIIACYFIYLKFLFFGLWLLGFHGISIYYFSRPNIHAFYSSTSSSKTNFLLKYSIVGLCIVFVLMFYNQSERLKIFKSYIINPIPTSVRIIN